ncbi:MAG: hypothetical protein LBJ11_04555 [Oscillospiraceae bacterium]|nr:hypothetical protein [Oscillospiraceae bacterium]
MKNNLLSMFNAGLYAVFLQNLVFSGGFGTTEAIRTAKKNGRLLSASLAISLFSAVTTVICQLLTTLPRLATLPFIWLAALYGGVLLGLYLLAAGLSVLLPLPRKTLVLRRIGMYCLNTIVFAVPLLSFRLGYSIFQGLAYGLTAGLAFAAATLLINAGMATLRENKAIPPMFFGLPATLIYTGLLALAFTGFTGAPLTF